MMPTNSKGRGGTQTPSPPSNYELERFILLEENKCHKTLEKLLKRLADMDTWGLHDEIELQVAQEKLHLLEEIKSICIKLNLHIII